MILESQLKAGRGVETPGWRREMEVWRKKRGITQELNRVMWLEMRLGSRQEPSKALQAREYFVQCHRMQLTLHGM